VPGIAFGADEFVRISYATSMDRIREGIARIDAALRRLD
jgi:aspartate aminotransferase